MISSRSTNRLPTGWPSRRYMARSAISRMAPLAPSFGRLLGLAVRFERLVVGVGLFRGWERASVIFIPIAAKLIC